MLTVIVSTISNSQVFLLENFCLVVAATYIFLAKNTKIYVIFNDQSFNDMLTNNIITVLSTSLGKTFFAWCFI